MPAPQVTVKRPVAVTSVTLLQLLLGLLWLGITLYLLLFSRSAEMKQGSDSAEAIHGLEIAAAVVAPPAVFGLIAVYALSKGKLWVEPCRCSDGWLSQQLISLASRIGDVR